MKKLILFIAILAFGNDTKEILSLIHLLDNKSFSYREVSNIYNPFVKRQDGMNTNISKIKYSPIIRKNTKYVLEVVFQNRVRINNNWYKNGDKLDNYIIIMKKNKVYLKNKKKMILLNKKSIIKVN